MLDYIGLLCYCVLSESETDTATGLHHATFILWIRLWSQYYGNCALSFGNNKNETKKFENIIAPDIEISLKIRCNAAIEHTFNVYYTLSNCALTAKQSGDIHLNGIAKHNIRLHSMTPE